MWPGRSKSKSKRKRCGPPEDAAGSNHSMAGDTWGKAASHAEKKGYIDRWDFNRLNLLRETPQIEGMSMRSQCSKIDSLCVCRELLQPPWETWGARRWLSDERLEELKAEHHRDSWKQRAADADSSWTSWEQKEKKKDKEDDSQAHMLEEILGDLDAELRTKTKKEEKQLDDERRAKEEKKRESVELQREREEAKKKTKQQELEKQKVEEEERRKKMDEAKQAELEKRRLEKEAKSRRAQEKFKERSDQQKKEKEAKKERKEKERKEGQTKEFRVKEEFAQSWADLPDEQIWLTAVKVRDSGGKMHYLQRGFFQEVAEEEMRNLESRLTERCAHAFSFPQRQTT